MMHLLHHRMQLVVGHCCILETCLSQDGIGLVMVNLCPWAIAVLCSLQMVVSWVLDCRIGSSTQLPSMQMEDTHQARIMSVFDRASCFIPSIMLVGKSPVAVIRKRALCVYLLAECMAAWKHYNAHAHMGM